MYYQEESQGFSWNKKMGIAAASLMLAGGGMLGVATVINSGSALDSAVAADQTVDGVAQATDGIGTSPGGSNAEPVGQTPTPGSGSSGGSGGSGGTGDSSDLEPSAPGTEPEPEPSDPPVGDPDPGNPNPGGPWELELPDGPMAPPAADPTPKPNPHPPLDLGDNLAEEVKELLNG